MAVTGPRRSGAGIVDAADDVDVVAQRLERREARRQFETRTGFARNPVPLGNAVAVEPEYEPGRHGFRRGGVGRPIAGEPRGQRWQPNPDCRAGDADALKEPSSGDMHVKVPLRIVAHEPEKSTFL